ncbi:hypothetical protein pb186bvf_009469 [Paramecium bursaria]
MSNAKSEGDKYMDEPIRFQNFGPHEDVPQQDQNLEYYNEYLRLYIANVVLTNQLKELLNEKNELVNKLARLERRNQELNSNVEETGEERKKRLRRPAQEIERHFKCPVENCQKQYGAEGSLNQHIKLKHPEVMKDRSFFTKSDQEEESGSQKVEQNQ